MNKWKKWSKRITITLAAIVVVLMLFHQYATYETSKRYPMPGRRVDIGDGYELHYYFRGEGSHTILIDAGLSGGSYDFEKIQEDLSDVARVCVFDRGGYGWSDHIPGPRSSKQIVSEMHAMLQIVPELKPPVILAGHSFGGQNVRLYASTCPEDVEALVLIDALNTDVYDGPPTSNMPWHFHVLNATHWLGLQRFFLGMRRW